MRRSLIRQFNLLIIFTVVIYVISTVSLYAFIYKNVINELQEEILLLNANEISYMVDHFVQDEILMLSRFANSQKTKQWLLSIQDEETYNNMEDVLLVYSKLINVESIFIVDDKEKRYYTSTRVDNIFEKPTFDHILSEGNDDDLWYYNTLETTKNYDVNIGKELKSDDLCLWVNIIVSHEVLIDYRLKLQVSSFTQLDVLMNVYKVNLDGVEYYEGIMKDITKIIKDEKQLIKRANYDNLTGVLSRAAFINHLDEFISYHFQEKAFSYFITFDFDYFKLINDKFGHLAGDQVLKSVLDTISSSIGELGVIGRIGGDEFAAIIWEIHENHIFDFLDQLRQTVAELEIDYNGELLQMTISIGYTVCNASDNFKRLYYRSDQALYEAKGLGKNTICKNNG